VNLLNIEIPSENMREKPNVLCLVTWCTHHVTRHNTPNHSVLSTVPQLSISQKALGTLPEDDNVMQKRVGNIHNYKLNE
jgi:hypothetical protein